ncbi:MAG: hypothetical protein HN572_01950, partial [Kordiimonadaceae bacterium]|nr:hypothetical protein [Kordiimonadaceae bacterium]
MNWLILIAASTVSSAIIIYALWPRTAEAKYWKKIISLLVLSAFAFPAGLNYYFIDQSQNISSAMNNKPIDYDTLGDPVWTGPMSRKPQPTADQMSMSSVTARLEAKLNQNPDDISGWILLGRSYVALGQPQRAVTLFEERLDEKPGNIDLLLSYGETLTEFNQGNVSDKAKALFEEAAKTEPTNPRVEYNIALYEIQHGQAQEAFDRLNSLLNGAPTNAPWISQIKQRMEDAAGQLNNATTSRPMKQPSQEQIMEVSSMSAGDQDAF